MAIWLLERLDRFDYNEYVAKVIRAKTAKEARFLANQDVGYEGKVWTDTDIVRCRKINPDGKNKVISTDYLAGY